MSAPLSEAALAELEALSAAATPGPWAGSHGTVCNWPTGAPQPDELVEWLPNQEHARADADAALIAAARNALPALCAEARRQQRVIAAMRRVLESCAADAATLPDCVLHGDCGCSSHAAKRLLAALDGGAT